MKKILLFCFVIFLSVASLFAQNLSVWDGSAAVWTNGSGTSADPYLIESAEHLSYLATSVNNGTTYDGIYFKMTNDLDLNNLEWTPIGSSQTNSFKGHFHGGNYRIYGLSIDILQSTSTTTQAYIGLFGYVNGGTIRNLELSDGCSVRVHLTARCPVSVGGLVGEMRTATSLIDSCRSAAYVAVSTSFTSSTHTTTIYQGGIVGYIQYADITNTMNTGKISYDFYCSNASTSNYSSYARVGGLAGYANGIDVTSSSNNGNIDVKNRISAYYRTSEVYVGGLVGEASATSSYPMRYTKSFSTGDLTLNNDVYHNYTSSSYASYGYIYAGGLVGYASSGYHTVANCYNLGDLRPTVKSAYFSYNSAYSQLYCAGFFGYLSSTTSTTFQNSYSVGVVPETPTRIATSNMGSSSYSKDAFFYLYSGTLNAQNCWFLNTAAVSNVHGGINGSLAYFRTTEMVDNLHNGGSGIWAQDLQPYANGGFPKLIDAPYQPSIITLPAQPVMGSHARLKGRIDTAVLGYGFADLNAIGFEYKKTTDAAFTVAPITPNSEDLFLNLSTLTPATNYQFRAFVRVNGTTLYGEIFNFTTAQDQLVRIDTVLCHDEPLDFHGETFTTADLHFLRSNDTTYTINLIYQPSRICTIDTTLMWNETLEINGVPYTQSGRYEIRFNTDAYGCDSVVILTLFQVLENNTSIWDGTTRQWVFGDGTASDPYIIENAQQLAYVALTTNAGESYAGKHFRIISDLDLNDLPWTPIGSLSTTPFSGTIDAEGHDITNLNITVENGSPQEYSGLFGYVSNGQLSNFNIIGTDSIVFNNSTDGQTYYISPLVARALYTDIINCVNGMPIYVNNLAHPQNVFMGGIVGSMEGGDVSTSRNNGDLILVSTVGTGGSTTSSYFFAGGIAGRMTSGNYAIAQSMNTGNFDLRASMETNSTTSYTVYYHLGGIVGTLTQADILECSNTGNFNINAGSAAYSKYIYVYSGGLVATSTGGSSYPILIEKSYNKGDFHMQDRAYTSGSYTSSTSQFAGGLIGSCTSGYTTVDNCYNHGNFYPTVNSTSSSSGYATVTVTLGGLIGYLSTTSNNAIRNSYNIGTIPDALTNMGTNGNLTYRKDALLYYSSSFTATNCYHLDECCVTNAHGSTPTTSAVFLSSGIIDALNVGDPGSGVWAMDVPSYVNNRYPKLGGADYVSGLSTLPARPIYGNAAQLNGRIDTSVVGVGLANIAQIGFGYKPASAANFIVQTVTPTGSDFSFMLNTLTPCENYQFFAFATINGNTIYGDTLNFVAPCDQLVTINTTQCYDVPFHFHGATFTTAGTHYLRSNDTTFTINITYMPSRVRVIDTTLLWYEDVVVDGASYSQSGRWELHFDTDEFGCDSVVFLTIFQGLEDNISVWDGDAAPWYFGDGTENDPYIIENTQQLAYLALTTNSGESYAGDHFRIIADLDLNDIAWTPIGNLTTTPFSGVIDGEGHTITNLNLTDEGGVPAIYTGLFGYATNAEIRNINIVGGDTISVVNSTSNGTFYIGAVVASANNSILEGCSNEMPIVVSNAARCTLYVGGISGYFTNGTMSDVQNDGYLTVDNALTQRQTTHTMIHLGGITGFFGANNKSMTRALNTGYITLNSDLQSAYTSTAVRCSLFVGGISGYLNYASLHESGNTGHLDLLNKASAHQKYGYLYAGGVVGFGQASSTYTQTVSKTYNKGNIAVNGHGYSTSTSSNYQSQSYNYTGGLMGYITAGYTTITDCFNHGDITPTTYAHSTTNARVEHYIGGFVGRLNSYTNVFVRNSYTIGTIPPSVTNSGSSTATVYSVDAAAYSTAATFSVTNSYYKQGCCAVNAHTCTETPDVTLKSPGMPDALNIGNPGSGIWVQDRNFLNRGYPMFHGVEFTPWVETGQVTDLTNVSATFNGTINANIADMDSITEVGFEYKLSRNSTYTTIPISPIDDTISLLVGNLQACSTYTYHAYAIVNGVDKIVGNDVTFIPTCGTPQTFDIDTTLCHGTALVFRGSVYMEAGTYQKVVGLNTYNITLSYYPQAKDTIRAQLCQGQNYMLNGGAYSQPGTYYLDMGVNENGCDSSVTLILTRSNNVPPTVGISGDDAPICAGTEVELTATGAVRYEWSTNAQTDAVTISAPGTYTVTGYDANNCAGTATIVIPSLSGNPQISGNTSICNGSMTTLTASLSDSYLWSTGETTQSISVAPSTHTTYWVKTTNNGCTDSVAVRVTVTAGEAVNISGISTICAGAQTILTATGGSDYLWSTGETTAQIIVTPSQSTTYQVTSSSGSCAAVSSIMVHVNQPVMNGFVINTTQPYTWNGQTYVETGIYTQTFVAANGCDSVVTLNLTINTDGGGGGVQTITLYDTICQGLNYSESGFVLATAHLTPGDYRYIEYVEEQITTLYLTILPRQTGTIFAEVCQNGTYQAHDFNIDASTLTIGTHQFSRTIPMENQRCDSIVTLHLTVNQTVTTHLSAEVCRGEVFNEYGFAITTSDMIAGTSSFVRTLYNARGCDSTITLQLTVYEPVTTNLTDHICAGGLYAANGFVIDVSGSQPGTYTHTMTLQTVHGCDSIVNLTLTVDAPLATTIVDTICAGEAYLRNGFGIATAGLSAGVHTFANHFFTARGCDSVVNLQLLVNQQVTTNLTAAIPSGTTYNENGFSNLTVPGVYTLVLEAANGCDSIVSLTLTVTQQSISDIYETACEQYEWFGATITQSGTYVHVIEDGNQFGGDSIVNLHLTITHASSADIYETSCAAFTWGLTGETYLSSGDYTAHLFNSSGCDSIVTLHLTISSPSTRDIYQTACSSYLWSLTGETYSESGTYDYVMSGGNGSGCDSVVVLHLTILQPSYSELSKTICNEYRWDLSNTIYYESGDYQVILENSVGCDSIVTLHLTINQGVTTEMTVYTTKPYYWAATGETYHLSGVYYYTYYNAAANGCDSSLKLNLVIEIDPTSIEDADNQAVISAYPNPANDYIDVKLDGDVDVSELMLFDMYGKLVKREAMAGSVHRMTLTDCASGIYMLRLQNNGTIVRTIKVVKR